MAPNMKAIDRLADVEADLDTAEREAEDTRRENRSAKELVYFIYAARHMSIGLVEEIASVISFCSDRRVIPSPSQLLESL
jgi:hypothetical protein